MRPAHTSRPPDLGLDLARSRQSGAGGGRRGAPTDHGERLGRRALARPEDGPRGPAPRPAPAGPAEHLLGRHRGGPTRPGLGPRGVHRASSAWRAPRCPTGSATSSRLHRALLSGRDGVRLARPGGPLTYAADRVGGRRRLVLVAQRVRELVLGQPRPHHGDAPPRRIGTSPAMAKVGGQPDRLGHRAGQRHRDRHQADGDEEVERGDPAEHVRRHPALQQGAPDDHRGARRAPRHGTPRPRSARPRWPARSPASGRQPTPHSRSITVR